MLRATGVVQPCITGRRTGTLERCFLRLRVVVVSVVLLSSPTSRGESYGDWYGHVNVRTCVQTATLLNPSQCQAITSEGYEQASVPKQRKMKIGETRLCFFSRVALLSRPEACQLWSGVTAGGGGVIECGDVSCYRWSERGLRALAQCLAIVNVKFAQTFAFAFPIRRRKLFRFVGNLSRQETNQSQTTATMTTMSKLIAQHAYQ